ncbi:MAG: alginate lyase family protein [Phycisphaerales bacterium]|nr:MAG: alginate lyase family protein [Phycisphaerales bacterium]
MDQTLGSEPFGRDLLTQANAVAANRLSFFDLRDFHLGDEVRWNYEYKAGKPTPLGFAGAIDYRNHRVTGDCKFVWELNRHHQLVVLGRAYRASGEVRYAEAAVRLLTSWLDQCPYGEGMNWRSPLELGVRLVNWVWAMELIGPSGLVAGELEERVLALAYRHLWDISGKYSRYSSANNHLVGEAAGVFIGSSYFPQLKGSERWRNESQAILEREILNQTYSDGGTREQAFGYHLFVLQFFVLSGLMARSTGRDFGEAYWRRLEQMFEFIALLTDGGPLPMVGDCDDGYVLDLGGRDDIVRSYMTVGAILFDRADFKARASGFSEPAFWLFGPAGRERYERIGVDDVPAAIQPHAFPESGYYLLQRGHPDSADRISVVFDCGDLGFGSIAAHGHADALSVTLRAFGSDVLVDPGTYDYFTYEPWRMYFRSTRAHNTVVIDEQDQSEMLGLFLWGKRARSRCTRWRSSVRGGEVVGEHDGYRRLSDPVVHRRRVAMDEDGPLIVVEDEIVAEGRHTIELNWHLAERCRAVARGAHELVIDCDAGVVTMELDPRLTVTTAHGGEEPIRGWVSRGYHQKSPATCITGTCEHEGMLSLRTRIRVGS